MRDDEVRLELYIPALRRYAWALTRHRDEADDLVQDCLERALSRGATRRRDGNLRAWLFSILHNVFVSGRRKASLRRTSTLDEAPEPAVDGGQEGRVAMNDLLAALDTLPEEQRAVLLLVSVEDLSYEAAAAALGVPIGTIMSRLSRARERLRRAVEGRLVDERAQPRLKVIR